MDDLNINITELHAHVLPIFWPILWLNIYALRRWYAQYGANIGGVAIATSNFGNIQITITYPRADAELSHLRVFEDTTEVWCMDQTGFVANMFAGANRLKLHTISDFLSAFTTRAPLT